MQHIKTSQPNKYNLSAFKVIKTVCIQHYINLVINFGMDFTLTFDWIKDANQTEVSKNTTQEEVLN